MANMSKELASKWLGVVDLDGEETVECVITSIDSETLKNADGTSEDKWVASLKNRQGEMKPMISNKTNLRNLMNGIPHLKINGLGPESNDWIGKRATLYTEMTTNPSSGSSVAGLRIRPSKAKAAAAAPVPAGPDEGDGPAGDEFDDDIPF